MNYSMQHKSLLYYWRVYFYIGVNFISLIVIKMFFIWMYDTHVEIKGHFIVQIKVYLLFSLFESFQFSVFNCW